MLASSTSRKLLVLLLVIVGSLLIVTLYKMQTFTTHFYSQRAGKPFSSLSALWTPEQFSEADRKTGLSWEAPLLKTKEDQVTAGENLHKLLIKDGVQYNCTDIKNIKNRREGAWKYCQDKYFAIQKPCLVYSFGIDYDFTFDDAMGELGCHVFSFDPSMNTSSHRRNPHVMFYPIGLGGEDTDTFEPAMSRYVKKKTFWKMRTLKSLLQELNHFNRTIDLLKVDVESSEWAVVRNMLDTGVLRHVKQFLLEWHIFPKYPTKDTFLRLMEVLADLHKAGFKSFDKHPHPKNLNWDKFNLQSDIGYVNVNYVRAS